MKLCGAGKIIVAEVNKKRAKMAQKMGADVIVNPEKENLRDVVLSLTGIGADTSIDCVGCLLTDATAVLRRGGRALIFGMNSNACCSCTQYDITRRELTIIGTYISNHSFPAVIRLLESGRMPLDKLITHRIKLSELGKGLDAMRSGRRDRSHSDTVTEKKNIRNEKAPGDSGLRGFCF